MELIKLQENKFILVSDEQPTQWYLDDTNAIRRVVTDDKDYWLNRTGYKAIIAGIPELPSIDFSLLSEEDCKTIGWVDVEKLVRQKCDTYDPMFGEVIDEASQSYSNGLFNGFNEGFKTAQSLNDKMFSLEDMGYAIAQAYLEGVERNNYGEQLKNDIIQSLQQTVWDVDVEMDYFYMSSKEFYGKDADWVKCDKSQYGSIQQTIPTCPIKIEPKISNNSSIKVTKILVK